MDTSDGSADTERILSDLGQDREICGGVWTRSTTDPTASPARAMTSTRFPVPALVGANITGCGHPTIVVRRFVRIS